MVQVLYLLEVFILAHYYGPSSTETSTTETTIVRCHKNSWIYLTSTYYWWLLRPTLTIRFNSKFQIIAQLFDSIRNEKSLFTQHYCDPSLLWRCWLGNTKGIRHVKSTVTTFLKVHCWDRPHLQWLQINGLSKQKLECLYNAMQTWTCPGQSFLSTLQTTNGKLHILIWSAQLLTTLSDTVELFQHF